MTPTAATLASPVDRAGADVPASPPTPVVLTARASEMAQQAMADDQLTGHGLRVGVIGGGCSGLQYLLDFAPAPLTEDFASRQHGVDVFIDPFSAAHLQGTTIDYVDGLQGAGFKFDNPNIIRQCGCGSSFTT